MSESGDSEQEAPFMVRLFYRTGSFCRPEEFASHSLPQYVPIYTWSNSTLRDLAMDLADAKPSALPMPSIGTRLAFQLVCPDLRGTSSFGDSEPRFAVKDLGSVVIGEGGPGAETDDSVGGQMGTGEGSKTLRDARFVVGDYINCAVLPPLSDGSVAPALNAKVTTSARGGREASYSRGSRGGRREVYHDPGARIPSGDWMRGERAMDREGGRFSGRGRGRW